MLHHQWVTLKQVRHRRRQTADAPVGREGREGGGGNSQRQTPGKQSASVKAYPSVCSHRPPSASSQLQTPTTIKPLSPPPKPHTHSLAPEAVPLLIVPWQPDVQDFCQLAAQPGALEVPEKPTENINISYASLDRCRYGTRSELRTPHTNVPWTASDL